MIIYIIIANYVELNCCKCFILLDASGVMAKERGAKLYATDER